MIGLIIFIVILVYVLNKTNATTKQGRRNFNTPPMQNNMNNQGNNTYGTNNTYQPNNTYQRKAANNAYQKNNAADNSYRDSATNPKLDELSEAQKRYQQRVQEYNKNKYIKPVSVENVSRTNQTRATTAYQKNNEIVQKAKKNNDKLKEDTTLAEIEKMHSHSERKVEKPVEHSTVCQSHQNNADVIVPEESILGSIEDLMIKGYDGSMSFERDFVGEALDMISNFTIPDTSVGISDSV